MKEFFDIANTIENRPAATLRRRIRLKPANVRRIEPVAQRLARWHWCK
jgi:hypothetical protein